MKDDVFFDSNILLYATGPQGRHRTIAEAALIEGGFISVQVLNEFANVARRKMKLSWQETDHALRVIRRLCKAPLAITLSTHELAMKTAARGGFSFYDSLIIAAALEARCTILLSEDIQHGRTIEDRLTIRNPFLA